MDLMWSAKPKTFPFDLLQKRFVSLWLTGTFLVASRVERYFSAVVFLNNGTSQLEHAIHLTYFIGCIETRKLHQLFGVTQLSRYRVSSPLLLFFKFIYFEREGGRREGKDRGGIPSRFCAFSAALCGFWSHEPWDHDLSRNQESHA